MRRTKVVVYNAPVVLSDDYLASFLSTYGQVEEVIPLKGGTGMANGNYAFILCLKREGFQAIPDTIQFHNLKLLIIVGHVVSQDICPRISDGWGRFLTT